MKAAVVNLGHGLGALLSVGPAALFGLLPGKWPFRVGIALLAAGLSGAVLGPFILVDRTLQGSVPGAIGTAYVAGIALVFAGLGAAAALRHLAWSLDAGKAAGLAVAASAAAWTSPSVLLASLSAGSTFAYVETVQNEILFDRVTEARLRHRGNPTDAAVHDVYIAYLRFVEAVGHPMPADLKDFETFKANVLRLEEEAKAKAKTEGASPSGPIREDLDGTAPKEAETSLEAQGDGAEP
jgi:hypothetical protein